jgi:hypothetical protein
VENPDCFFHSVENRFPRRGKSGKSETGGGQKQAMKHPGRLPRRRFERIADRGVHRDGEGHDPTGPARTGVMPELRRGGASG